MPNRPEFKTYNKQSPPIPQPEPEYGFGSDDFLAGLVTDASSDNIPDNALQVIVNATFIRNQLLRRNGIVPYPIAAPNSEKVMAVFAFFETDTGVNVIRCTPSTIYKSEPDGWTAITGPTLHSTIVDYWTLTVADNRPFFSNGGADVIQEINPGLGTYAPLGNAPKYKYLASAFDRVIGASLRDTLDIPYQIGWSGALNYGEWDPSVDISSGNTPLVNSPSDLSDSITGLFSLSSVLCIPRERSIWLATNIPSATNPFNFFISVPGTGCDLPLTIAALTDGLIFYSHQKSAVYKYDPGPYISENGGKLEELSQNVARDIKDSVADPHTLFATYDKDTNSYSLYIPSGFTATVKCFTYNFNTNNWIYDEYYNISSADSLEFTSSDIRINQLTGTIAALLGPINLVGGIPADANRFFGFNDGTICTQSIFDGNISQVGLICLTDNLQPFTTTIQSKTCINPGYDTYFNILSIEYTPYTTGTITISYTKDDGLTFTLYKTITVTSGMLNQTQLILCKRSVRARRYSWQITTSTVMASWNNHKVLASLAGLSTK